MRLVLDTNVVASALLWGGAPRQLFILGRGVDLVFYSSAPMLRELTDILSRRKLSAKIAASLLSVDELVDLYAEQVALVRPVSIRRTAPDPDDDVAIGTALAAEAVFVVAGDKALLAVAIYEGGRIVSIREALELAP